MAIRLESLPKRIGLKSNIRHSAGAGKITLDYVTRPFNVSSDGLNKLVGLHLRRDTALRDFQINWSREVSRSKAAAQSGSWG